jgi:glycosyltransferase involved in cell wall biosynthesis
MGLSKGRVCFLVGSVALSGGTYVIFQHASYLRRQGYDVSLAVQHAFDAQTVAWHDEGPRLRCVPIEQAYAEPFDLVVATWWKTALELGAFNTPRHAYFVQSIESRFYPEQERPLRSLVEATYEMPVSYVTEATWIVKHLRKEFGRSAVLVRNGIRKDIYTADGVAVEPRVSGKPRILVEGHFNVAFKNTALAVRLARRAGARDIWVMTGSPIHNLPGVSRIFSRVPIGKTPEIYRSCDILIKLSTVEGMFGPPLEMFHCGGTALVFDVTGHDEYIRAGENAIVVPSRDTEHAVAELRSLLSDDQRLNALKGGALACANRWPDWDRSSAEFTRWVQDVLRAPKTDRQAIQNRANAAWARYGADEQQRLKNNPGMVWRRRAIGLARKLPPGIQDRIDRVRTLIEIMGPNSEVS